MQNTVDRFSHWKRASHREKVTEKNRSMNEWDRHRSTTSFRWSSNHNFVHKGEWFGVRARCAGFNDVLHFISGKNGRRRRFFFFLSLSLSLSLCPNLVVEAVFACLENDSHRELALKASLFIHRFLYSDKEQAVSFQELRLRLRKNILGDVSLLPLPFSLSRPDRYALSRTASSCRCARSRYESEK